MATPFNIPMWMDMSHTAPSLGECYSQLKAANRERTNFIQGQST